MSQFFVIITTFAQKVVSSRVMRNGPKAHFAAFKSSPLTFINNRLQKIIYPCQFSVFGNKHCNSSV